MERAVQQRARRLGDAVLGADEAGRSKPEKSSLALGLNSARTVSSLAVWVLGAFLKARGLLPVLAAFASSRPSSLAAGG